MVGTKVDDAGVDDAGVDAIEVLAGEDALEVPGELVESQFP